MTTGADDGDAQAGIPHGKVMLLNGYDRGYPDDGLATAVDPGATPVVRDAAAYAAPRFAAEGVMRFVGGTWRVDAPDAVGGMLFPRQAPLRAANLDPAAEYRVGGAIDATATPPVMDVQLIENFRQTGRKWILG